MHALKFFFFKNRHTIESVITWMSYFRNRLICFRSFITDAVSWKTDPMRFYAFDFFLQEKQRSSERPAALLGLIKCNVHTSSYCNYYILTVAFVSVPKTVSRRISRV